MTLTEICGELQALQRTRATIIRSRLMAANNRQSFVARLLGYYAGLDEKKRKELFAKADTIIAKIIADPKMVHPAAVVVRAGEPGIASFLHAQRETEKEMLALVVNLPVACWCELPEQRGFGLLSLAVVIGETGDLTGYSNPAKVWKRLGCAPWSFGDKTQMGATWKSKGGLPADQWSAFGYSPRRRSIAYVIGENLVKQNTLKTAGGGEAETDIERLVASPGTKQTASGDSSGGAEPERAARGRRKPRGGASRCGAESTVAAAGAVNGAGAGETHDDTDSAVARPGPYRLRYDSAKVAIAAAHPDYSKLRCHRHAMLLATKLLLKNLWKAWNPALDRGEYPNSVRGGEKVVVTEGCDAAADVPPTIPPARRKRAKAVAQ